jgi:urease accessory protein
MTVGYTADFFSQDGLNTLPKDGPDTWHAFLRLAIEKRKGRSALTQARHRGPLCVQKPFYPEGPDVAHLYVLHPPGGIVSGDELTLATDIKESAQALLTAPGAGRVYRARPSGNTQVQNIAIHVGKQGSLEWLPQENILYPGAKSAMHTQIKLDEQSHFIGWDITSFGLPARGELFDHGEFSQKFEIWQGNKPCFMERFTIAAQSRHLLVSRAGLQGHPIQGLFIAGPFAIEAFDYSLEVESHLLTLRELSKEATVREKTDDRRLIAGITCVDKFIVGRCLGDCSGTIKKLFTAYWATLRPALLNRPACPPRIWST